MTEYPKAFFEAVQIAENKFRANPTPEHRDDLAWWVAILAAKVSSWALSERVKDG